jgi:hypothetical protein
MRITFERTGGLMGRMVSLMLDLKDLSADQAETLRRLLDEANFFTLTESPSINQKPDGFQYTISVETNTIKHTVHASDATMPDGLRPLIQELSQRMRSQNRPKT